MHFSIEVYIILFIVSYHGILFQVESFVFLFFQEVILFSDGERKRLKKPAVPHLVAGPCEATDQQSRYLERQLKEKPSQEMIASSSTHGADLIVGEVQKVVTSLPEDTAAELDVKQVDVVPDTVITGIQVGQVGLSTERCMLSPSRIQNNPAAVKYIHVDFIVQSI